MSDSASSSAVIPSPAQTFFILSMSADGATRLKSKRWQRDSTVAGILCSSVVASMNITYFGGSSSVFKSALNAEMESICTSSMI